MYTYADNEGPDHIVRMCLLLRTCVARKLHKGPFCASRITGIRGTCGQRRPRSACAHAQADQGLRRPVRLQKHWKITEKLDTGDYIYNHRSNRPNRTDIQAEPGIHSPYMTQRNIFT